MADRQPPDWVPPSVQASRDKQISEIRQKLDDVTKAIDLCDIVAAEAPRPLWREILQPFLFKEVQGFKEAAISMGKEDFEKAQARAALAQALLDDIGGKADPALRPKLIEKAKRLNDILEKSSAE